MIYGNNVEANFEYFQRRMVEKALDALQTKHDELLGALIAIRDQAGSHTVAIGSTTGFALIYKMAETALRKAVEEAI